MKRTLEIIATFCIILFIFSSPTFGQKTGGDGENGGPTTEGGAALILRVSDLGGFDGNPIARGTGKTLLGCLFSNNGFPRGIKIKKVVVNDFAFLPSQQTAFAAFSPVSFTLGGVEIFASSTPTKLGRQYTFDFGSSNIIVSPGQARGGTLFAMVPSPIPAGHRGVDHQFFVESIEAESAVGNPSYNPVRVIFLSQPLQGPRITIVDTAAFVGFGRSGTDVNRLMSDNDLLAIVPVTGDGDIPNIFDIRVATMTFDLTLQNPTLITNIRLVLPDNSEIFGTTAILGEQLQVTFHLPGTGTLVPQFETKDFKLKINSSSLGGVELFTRLISVEFFDGPQSDSGAVLANFVAPSDYVFSVVYTSSNGPKKF